MPAALAGMIAPATHELWKRAGRTANIGLGSAEALNRTIIIGLKAAEVYDSQAVNRPPVYKAVGLTLAIASGVFIGISFVLKKVGLLKANVKYSEEAGEGYGYLKNAYWWAGMTLMIVGEICNFVAYAFVDAILVTPLGALSVVVTTILSAIFLKERLSFVGKMGCFICIIGSIVIVLNAPSQSSAANIQQMQDFVIHPGFLSYAGFIIIGCAIVAYYVGPRYGKKSMMVYLTICSLIGGLSVVATQGLGAAIITQISGEPQFNQWFLYVLLVFVVGTLLTEIIYLNKALNLFNAALVTPTYYVYFTSSTIVASAILFRGFKGTPLSIATIIMGFLQICAGVVLLQLSKSAKDVPDSAVLNGDLDQIRTVGEQESPESEPQADTLRGTAALLRRISVVRRGREEEEAKKVWEEKLKDQMEPIQEGETVEWDGLRRRKTIVGGPGSISRRKTLHPGLGLTKASGVDDEPEQRLPRRDTGDSLVFSSPTRRDTSGSRITFGTPFSPRPSFPMNEMSDGKGIPGEQLEMQHVHGMPSTMRSDSGSNVPPSRGTPTVRAVDFDDKNKSPRILALDGAGMKSPEIRSPAKRQFSFHNMFHKNKELPLRQDPNLLNVTTEEERLGLTRGDSNNGSSDDEDSPVYKTVSRSAAELGHGAGPRNLTIQNPPSHSSPEINTPGNGRPLPRLPADDDVNDDHDFEKELKDIERSPSEGKGKGT